MPPNITFNLGVLNFEDNLRKFMQAFQQTPISNFTTRQFDKKNTHNMKRKINQWAISDIHGCANTFRRLIENKIQPSKQDEIYLLGDYIDRGPCSKGVVDYIIRLQNQGYQLFTLKGNHEAVLLKCYKNDKYQLNTPDLLDLKKGWFRHGGKATLQSFGVSTAAEIPKKYIHFFNTLDYYKETGNFVLVHAGLNFNIQNPFHDKYAMLWTKSKQADLSKINNKRIVHGHVPATLSEIQRNIESSHTFSVDNGCVYQNRKEMGNLLALELNTLRLEVQKNIDFVKKNQVIIQMVS